MKLKRWTKKDRKKAIDDCIGLIAQWDIVAGKNTTNRRERAEKIVNAMEQIRKEFKKQHPQSEIDAIREQPELIDQILEPLTTKFFALFFSDE